MVKLMKQKKGNITISVPKAYIEHYGWDVETSRFNWCVSEHGLKLVELRRG